MATLDQEVIDRLESIETKVGQSRQKDIWDKISILSGFLSSFVLALVIFLVGIWIEYRNKAREDARVERESRSEQRRAERELSARELDVVVKFLPYFSNEASENDHRQAIELISELATVEVAAAIAKTVGTRGAEIALNEISRQGDLTTSGRDAVVNALRSIATRNPIVDSDEPSMGLRDSMIFRSLNEEQRGRLLAAIRATGRINIRAHPYLPYAGTAFLISPTIALTADYVAEILVSDLPESGESVAPLGSVSISFSDTGRDDGSSDEGQTKVSVLSVSRNTDSRGNFAILYIDDTSILGIEPVNIGHFSELDDIDTDIAIIGYSNFDSRVPADVSNEAFRGKFGVKRVLFGRVRGDISHITFNHDIAFTGSIGGAPVVRLRDGAVVGIHYQDSRRGGSATAEILELGRPGATECRPPESR